MQVICWPNVYQATVLYYMYLNTHPADGRGEIEQAFRCPFRRSYLTYNQEMMVSISSILCHIFNKSLTNGIYPETLKGISYTAIKRRHQV